MLFRRDVVVTGLASMCGFSAAAEKYPDKPLKIVVPVSTGGAFDTFARIVAGPLAEKLGQAVIVDNKPGAGGTIAALGVARQPRDPYSLFLGDVGTHCIAPFLYSKLGYDPIRDFTPVCLGATAPLVMVVNADIGVKSISEYIEYVKGKPGRTSFASGGTGGISHLSSEMFKSMANVDIVHVPYKGTAPSLSDLVSGIVQMTIASLSTVGPLIKAGKLKVLATTERTRIESLPDLPTIGEYLPGYAAEAWLGFFLSAGVPREVVDLLQRQIVALLKTPEVRSQILGQSLVPVGGSSELLVATLKADLSRWGKIVSQSGAKAD